jgi:beta-glucosidase/6-phospho-beta-glucosidase/beta-galactosidase
LMKEIGLDAYRFSVSWSRILPSKYRLKKPNMFPSYAHIYIQPELLDCYDSNFIVCLWLLEGTLEGGINQDGINYYKKLINLLLAEGKNIFSY